MDFKPSNAESLTVIQASTTTTINQGTGTFLSPIFDVRNFSSYYFAANAVESGAAPTGFNVISIQLNWWDTATGATRLFSDYGEVYVNQGAPIPQTVSGTVRWQDQMHGPYMSVWLTQGQNDNVNVTWKLEGTSRALSGPYWRSGTPNNTLSGMVLNSGAAVALPNGSTADLFSEFSYGMHRLHVQIGAGGVGFNMVCGTLGNVYSQVLAANANLETQLILPKVPAHLSIFNGSGVATTYTAQMTRQFDSV